MWCGSRPAPDYQTVILKVRMKGKKSKKKVTKILRDMESVDDYEVDEELQKVTVSGHVNPKKLARKLEWKSGYSVELWIESDLSEPNRTRSGLWRFDSSSIRNSFSRTSNMFSDDNPNSCTIM